MADQADVENALVDLASSALYPNGLDAQSIPGPTCRIYRGWPHSGALDADLAAGRINVTVFSADDPGANTTRYLHEVASGIAPHSLTVRTASDCIFFEGKADPGQLAGVLVNGQSYVYRTTAGDTPAHVAANLAASIGADFMAALSGASVTIPGAKSIVARVVADVPTLQELRRQTQKFRVICWCATPAARDSTAAAIDGILARYQFIGLPDGSCARLTYDGTTVFDQSQDALLYRRDLSYHVEYATTSSDHLPAMIFGNLGFNAEDRLS